MTGVSPAYFLSRSGPGFGPADMVSGLPFLAETGYGAFQAEVFIDSILPLWTEVATKAVADTARTNGLRCSAFVAHFIGTVFSSGKALSQGLPLVQTKAAVAIASSIISSIVVTKDDKPGNNQADDRSGSRVFVVPLPAFAWPEAPGTPGTGEKHDAECASRFRDIIETLSALCSSEDLLLALELLPGNILGGSSGFLGLVTEPGFADLGLLLDTGHFWAMREAVQDLPLTLRSRIVATHLCDNDGIVNLSLCPGDGTIPFPAMVKALGAAGYAGSLDLEIVCSRDSVETEYRRAFSRFRDITAQAFAVSDPTAQPDSKQAYRQQESHQFHKETI